MTNVAADGGEPPQNAEFYRHPTLADLLASAKPLLSVDDLLIDDGSASKRASASRTVVTPHASMRTVMSSKSRRPRAACNFIASSSWVCRLRRRPSQLRE